ncbi:DUF5392 family protein [Salirhabdus sp. Marseille-P4669]|uniref:DUF5392 family protein n=1 Tax=Salirhabdus sp. Marseille-P4669 TaxID=2042310 RepID=UPI000C7BB0C5|nr:DUF5392 family protein [Salirhabdus sp. Marseille-P4669]
MNPIVFKNMPTFVKKEMEIIMGVLKPYMKKFSKYRIFAIPLMVFPIMNLFLLLLSGGWYLDAIPTLAIYALMGAIGIALFKESKHVQKEMESISTERMIERINRSELLNDFTKKEYINTIKMQPKLGFQAFLQFLTEEHERKQRIHE